MSVLGSITRTPVAMNRDPVLIRAHLAIVPMRVCQPPELIRSIWF